VTLGGDSVVEGLDTRCGVLFLTSLKGNAVSKHITFIDLFAGIGGFHLAFHNLGAKCVFVSEWDEPARQTYEKNFVKIEPELFSKKNREKLFTGDITVVEAKDIPDFDILTGGFPCQPFSQAGLKKGFNETRGTLFFDIARIIKEKQPSAFFIENVRGLLNHNDGETFATIKKVITKDLGYSFYHKVIFASDFGVPQHRPRLFMVGFRDKKIKFDFPEPQELKITMSDIFGGQAEKKVGYTLRVGGRGSNINDRRNWDSYLVNGRVKRLSPKEGLKMQGFPDDFIFPVSEVQAMKQLGNSVAVPAIQATADQIIKALRKAAK
jgi:DNA (cytosine-5)-methyltransferase 1